MQKFNVGDGVNFESADGRRYLMCVMSDGAGYERVGGEFRWRVGAREVVHIDLFDETVIFGSSVTLADLLLSVGLRTEPICGSDDYGNAVRPACELFGELYAALTDDSDARQVSDIREWLPQLLSGRGEICEIYVMG